MASLESTEDLRPGACLSRSSSGENQEYPY
jgi:hypothetical protein